MTFGFQSAVNIATNALDCIHTTADSHSRIFIVEIMGHKVGWVTLHAGIAGGADVILLPEIPYDIDKVVDALNKREKQGKKFSIIAVAEGAISKEVSLLTKKERKKLALKSVYPSIGYEIADKLKEKMGQEIRVTVPGHTQRGGSPSAYDRVISTQFGVEAAKLIMEKDYGKMVAMQNGKVVGIPLEDIAGKLKVVEPESNIVKEAKLMGISFGD